MGKDLTKKKKQESCATNGGKTTKHLLLGRSSLKGDPISMFLFILVLETLLIYIKTKSEVEGLTIFDHCYLYYAYADDTMTQLLY